MRKLLVANRGEIAVRIFRTARQMGIRTVAVYSEADRDSVHVRSADEAIHIGPSEAAQSYLRVDRILDAAAESGADAIHPGYGFLSERTELVEGCGAVGITFVGPSASAMRTLGSKTDAKALAVAHNVPIVPGCFDPNATVVELRQAAIDIGLPVMLKAAAGGGGRGMRPVVDLADFEEALATASSEAVKSFGDGTMMVEKLVETPRHIEVQIVADAHGNVVPLFERECSIQRRHQKIIEEAPAPYPALDWQAMREAAVRLIRAAEYVGAGTVEFIVDSRTGAFYFLEVNARLQVEHPVTEAITGLDLVRQQLLVAQGLPLEISPSLMAGDRAAMTGHALEARVVAEDPSRNFLPSVGKIIVWNPPTATDIRIDSGYDAHSTVSRFYDSLLAKVIVHAPTRDEAISRLRAALLDFHILGVQTNLAFLLELLDTEAFARGDLDTGFIERELNDFRARVPPPELADIVCFDDAPAAGPWAQRDGFRNARQ